MTLMKSSNTLLPGFFFDDFFGRDWYQDERSGATMPAVNIHEDGDAYHVDLAAPGMNKKDFEVALEDQKLTISCEKEENMEKKDKGYTKREFNYTSFERSFMLPKSVVVDKVEAEYTNGILHVVIPKKDEAKLKAARRIEIS